MKPVLLLVLLSALVLAGCDTLRPAGSAGGGGGSVNGSAGLGMKF